MNIERIKHKLTAYHWRENRRDNLQICICSCGWKDPLMRNSIGDYWREFQCLLAGGHQWEEPYTAEASPVDFEDGGDYLWQTKRPERSSYSVENNAN